MKKAERREMDALIAQRLGYVPDPTDTRGMFNCYWQRGERDTPGSSAHWPGPPPYSERLEECARACDLIGWRWSVDGDPSFEPRARRYGATVFRPGDGPRFIHGAYAKTAALALTLALHDALLNEGEI